MSTGEAPPPWAQDLIERFDKLENTVNNCVMTRLDEIGQQVGTLTQQVGTLTQEVKTLTESYDDLRGMKDKVDELWSHFLSDEQS